MINYKIQDSLVVEKFPILSNNCKSYMFLAPYLIQKSSLKVIKLNHLMQSR